jgi:Uncharacterised nucleotidyltransferase
MPSPNGTLRPDTLVEVLGDRSHEGVTELSKAQKSCDRTAVDRIVDSTVDTVVDTVVDRIVHCLTQKTIGQVDQDLKDWKILDRTACRHKVYPQLYPILLNDSAFPTAERQFLQGSLHQHTLHCLTNFAELTRLLSVLHQADCFPIVFKGPILSQLAYGNLTSRVFRDLDLLLLPQDYLRIKPLLEAEGYHSVVDAQPTSPEQQQETCWAMGEYAMVSPEKSIWLDIHCQLVGRDLFALDLDLDSFFRNAQPLNCNARSVLTFSPEYTFLHLCINSAKDYWPNLQASQDLLALIDRHPNLDWDLIQLEAKRLRIQRLVWISLLIAQRYFGPDRQGDLFPLKIAGLNDRLARWVADRIVTRQRRSQPLGLVDRILCRLGSIETWRLRWDYLMIFPSRVVRIVFGSNQRDRKFVDLPPGLRFLYPVIRPVRLVVQYGVNGLKLLF